MAKNDIRTNDEIKAANNRKEGLASWVENTATGKGTTVKKGSEKSTGDRFNDSLEKAGFPEIPKKDRGAVVTAMEQENTKQVTKTLNKKAGQEVAKEKNTDIPQ